MKTLLTIFFLFFSFSLVADDISDFEIEGMSIGDSLLDYFSEDEINSFDKFYNPRNSKEFYQTNIYLTNQKYDMYRLHLRDKDNEYIIYALTGEIQYKNNINECKKLKKNVVTEIMSLFNNIKPINYESPYNFIEDGKSIAFVTDFELRGGSIRLWCRDWSKVVEEKRKWQDDFSVSLSSEEYLDWHEKSSD
tara:strand:- start:654 stop:1229 length:576 start_codon:yes stop_codon:yes gene_type:complete